MITRIALKTRRAAYAQLGMETWRLLSESSGAPSQAASNSSKSSDLALQCHRNLCACIPPLVSLSQLLRANFMLCHIDIVISGNQ